MSTRLAGAVNEHRFPPVFFRYPRLLGLVHWLMRLTTLRVWYVRRAFREVLATLPSTFYWVDAGCGHGDYILPAAARHPNARFLGIDKIEDNVAVSRAYARVRGLDNTAFEQARAEEYSYSPPADAISCIGVMQLVEDDLELLRRFHAGLKPTGTLLLYEAVHNRRVLPFFEDVLHRYFEPYDVVQHQRHFYTPDEVIGKLREAGFDVERIRHSYGTAGRLYFELYTLAMYVLLSAHWLWYPLLLPLFLACMPLFWLLMGVDYLGTRRSGNGIVLVARKLTRETSASKS